MTRFLPLAALLVSTLPLLAAAQGPAPAGAAAVAPADGNGMVSLSLVEALAAIKEPQLAGIFSFVSEKDSPFAFADLIARDRKARRRYLGKLDADRTAAGGLTPWDHQVCASLVNLYASPLGSTFGTPGKKRMASINECVLSAVVPLEQIVAKRKK